MYICMCYVGKHEMYSFKESSTCEYDAVILSPSLCSHPDYRPEEATESVITCRPDNEETPYKPKSMLEMEVESLRLRSERMFEGNFMQGDQPGRATYTYIIYIIVSTYIVNEFDLYLVSNRICAH